jgi:hypothetical protein
VSKQDINKTIKEQYEKVMVQGLSFLQIFPPMFQDGNIAETARRIR